MKLYKAEKLTVLLSGLICQLELFSLRASTRKQMLMLDKHLLKDVGLTQQQASQEAGRYFWQGDNSMNADSASIEKTEKEYSIKTSSEGLFS